MVNPWKAADGTTIPAVYLVPFHRAETSLAAGMLRLLTSNADRMPAFATVDWAKALAWLHARTGTELAAEQQQAVRLALTTKVAVVTCGPGCGRESLQLLEATGRLYHSSGSPADRQGRRAM